MSVTTSSRHRVGGPLRLWLAAHAALRRGARRLLDERGSGWTATQFAAARFCLGVYLAIHFAYLVPWSAELFSRAGMLPRAELSPLARAFPNVLALCDGPGFVTALTVAGAGLAVALALGVRERLSALALWYLWACLFGRNPLIGNPGMPYVGLILLLVAAVPRATREGRFQLPRAALNVLWVAMAVGYSYSGLTKLVSPSWLDGAAVLHILNNPLARPGALRDALLAAPPALLMLCTWGVLLLEIAFAPLALSRRLRPWLWGLMLAMHIGLVALIDFADLSFGMILLHLFTFDPRWLEGGSTRDLKTRAHERILNR